MSRSNTSIEILPNVHDGDQLYSYIDRQGIDRALLLEARSSAKARAELLEQLQKAGNPNPKQALQDLLFYEQVLERRKEWEKRAPSTQAHERTRGKRSKAWMLMLPAAVFAGMGVYYSGLGKALLATLPDYSGSVRRIGDQAARPAAPGMRLEGGGTGVFPAPTNPPPNPMSPPMGGAGNRPI
jgi:hypothetical protein